MREPEDAVERPLPELEGRPLTFEQYEALTPEKLELIEGYLIRGPNHSEHRRNLLSLLLLNEGLLQAVRLAPPERWQAALRQVYGDP